MLDPPPPLHSQQMVARDTGPSSSSSSLSGDGARDAGPSSPSSSLSADGARDAGPSSPYSLYTGGNQGCLAHDIMESLSELGLVYTVG
jgi:hypothetical protein